MLHRHPVLRCAPVLGALLCIACASSAASTRPAMTGTARTRTATTRTATPRTVRASAQVVSVAVATTPPKPAPRLPLAGKVVGVDPGHNGRNYADPSFINRLIWNGRERETCDTTGTSTDGGYTEARFNFDVARDLTRDLRDEGARVVLTRTTNDGVGPCVTTRAQILNRARANVAIDIHADGGPSGGRGFAILEPVADGPNNRVIGSSRRFGSDLRRVYRSVTGMPVSTYDGVDGIAYRDDLAGLNLTTVPKVLIECGNMRNAIDAGLLVRSSFQQRAAQAFARAITQFETGR